MRDLRSEILKQFAQFKISFLFFSTSFCFFRGKENLREFGVPFSQLREKFTKRSAEFPQIFLAPKKAERNGEKKGKKFETEREVLHFTTQVSHEANASLFLCLSALSLYFSLFLSLSFSYSIQQSSQRFCFTHSDRDPFHIQWTMEMRFSEKFAFSRGRFSLETGKFDLREANFPLRQGNLPRVEENFPEIVEPKYSLTGHGTIPSRCIVGLKK